MIEELIDIILTGLSTNRTKPKKLSYCEYGFLHPYELGIDQDATDQQDRLLFENTSVRLLLFG